jgi:drug/metabolite transporter (DMT)-like permease
MLAGTAIMLPIGGSQASAQLLAVAPAPLAAMLALSIVATAIATVVFLKLVAAAGPSFTSFINYLIPVWAFLMGVMFMGEQPAATVVLGLALILSGIALSEVGSRHPVRNQGRLDARERL